MSLRILTTPIDGTVHRPSERPGGFNPRLREALIQAESTDRLAERLDQADALVVTTGQQPGLFTGPLYTVYKALSAAALARQLEAAWRRPVIPIFWSAGDDHDFAEANHAAWPAADGSVHRVTLRERAADAALTPSYREVLGPEVEPALAALAEDLPPSDFREATLDWLRTHYRPDATLAAAYQGALAELLAPSGILVLDSTHPAVKHAAAPLLLRAAAMAAVLDDELSERHGELTRQGRDPGVTVGDGATLVMVEAGQGRDRLVLAKEGFTTRRSGERFDTAALDRIAEESPERLSPNVLLRPVVESAILPTVAYVAGPGELRYLSLTPPLYRALEVPRQQPVPRWSGVLVEPKVTRVLEKFGLELDDLLTPGHAVEARVVRDQLPDTAAAALERLRREIERLYGELGGVATEIDPTLAKPIESFRNQALSGTHDAERKLVQHLKKRQATELAQLSRARTAVLPDGKPQERVFTIAPYLSRYGPAILPAIADEVNRWYAGALEGAAAPA